MNPIEALEAAGLKPIIIDEDTDIELVLGDRLRKEETNEQFITRVMNYGCPTGGLIQPFIIQALEVYVRMVDSWEPSAEEEQGLVEPLAWKRTAVWLAKELEKKYGS